MDNFTKKFVISGAATVMEIYVSIMGACLPTLVPVYRKLRYGDPLKTCTNTAPQDTKLESGSKSRRANFSHDDRLFQRLETSEDALAPSMHLKNYHVNVSSTKRNKSLAYTDVESYPVGGIMVRHDLVWSENDKARSAI
ncbi:hypothetical protein Daus18300_013411 [Diaporthe australafricana]|uniref:Integral membrane protein n=1 Tax=Diaporthe australafricana TaxID=127596 RepID=A0ABR3VZ51_9PEZI